MVRVSLFCRLVCLRNIYIHPKIFETFVGCYTRSLLGDSTFPRFMQTRTLTAWLLLRGLPRPSTINVLLEAVSRFNNH